MNLQNATDFLAGYSLGRLKSGRSCIVMVAKATFDIPDNPHDTPVLSQEQIPLYEADTYIGEPGFSAVLYENDYAPYKPFCDVVLHGSAYAPPGESVESVKVRLTLVDIDKQFRVVGDRHWIFNGVKMTPSTPPVPFQYQAIHYGCAFGGMGDANNNPDKPYGFAGNPVGVGYNKHTQIDLMEGLPLPNTEEVDFPVRRRKGRYKPMSFGPIARNFPDRYPLAGTYDQHWLDNVSPFWPDDFDERYHQCAPLDQQTRHLRGNEVVSLINLTEEGVTRFKIPNLEVPMMVLNKQNQKEVLKPVIDTLAIESDNNRFSIVWRANRPIKIDVTEVDKIVVGKLSNAWWKAMRTGKKWNPHIKKKDRNSQ